MYVIATILLIGTVALSSILHGWVLSIMWDWFFVPILKLPSLSIPQAIGIALVVGYLTHQRAPSSKEKDENYEVIAYTFLYPFLTLAIGWIVKNFV